MPELPEVETVVRDLDLRLPGSIVERLQLHAPRVYRHTTAESLKHAVEGGQIKKVGRRGKFILIDFDADGHERPSLAIHLRMSGQIVFGHELPQKRWPYVRASFFFHQGSPELPRQAAPMHFVDVRQFGTFFLIDGTEPEGFKRLGVEPLSPIFTAAKLAELLAGRRTSLKAFLLQQNTVAGVGNIYACEALWKAKLNPERPAGDLNGDEIKRLHRAIRAVLRDAVEQMGTTFSDFLRPDGEPGEYGNELRVYGREGERCHECGRKIRRMVQHGRSTFYCYRCQHLPGRRGGRR